MYILGFDCYGHDAAAAIIKDGDLLGFVEEERFLRCKHTPDFPIHAMQWCCREAGITPRDLDHIVYYWNPYLGLGGRLAHILRYFPRSIGLVRSRGDKFLDMLRMKRTVWDRLGLDGGKTRFHYSEHHLMHAASTFLTSPYSKAAIMSVDAAGEWCCTWLGYGDGLDLHCLKKINFPHSLGLVYGGITEYLGFLFASGEGKVMGLAPYGDASRYIDEFRKIIVCTSEGEYRVDLSYFEYHLKGRPHWWSSKFLDTFGPARAKDGEVTRHYMDVAAALQQRTEEVCFHMADWLHQQTGLPTVCLAGGVCLNSVMNGRLLKRGPFREVWVQPAANDAGTSIGACYWLWNNQLRHPRTYVMEHAYLGCHYTKENFGSAIRQAGYEAQHVDNAPKRAAELLAAGKIVGWFDGRMECGPRALGNRSILANPCQAEMKDILNARVKFRESFRPFAPSVPEERCGDYFDVDYPSPYMILVYDVLAHMRDKVPAITHVDGTGRVQTVSRRHNPRYHALIERFGELTGVYCILNTSFNIRGQPIVNTPEQALECYQNTGMDALFLGDYLLCKDIDSAAAAMSETAAKAAQAAAAAND
ncbi:MAG: carbamoyl transferase [Phycisphaerales bacterium]|nr:carbamoyl transferase [Phycisphaerales bacterium]